MIKTTNPPIRAFGIILMFLLSLGIKAQTPNTALLTWDQEVGCIEYDDERSVPYVYLSESIDEGECLRFCEGSIVNYVLQTNNVASVTWQVTGGSLENSSTSGAAIRWGSSGMGSIMLTITYNDGRIEVKTICVEKIVSPHAEFSINGIDPDQKEFCINMPISFDNLSTENNGSAIVHYFWDFGDGTTSSLFEPTHTYSNAGHYAVRLTVTNSCNCTSEYAMKIDIADVKAIEITCANVTCEYDQERYEANDGCGGEWEVIGGTIVGGGSGNTFVDVVWDQVDPEDGFGYVSYKSDCECPHWNTVKIPVVLNQGLIKGPNVICKGKQGRFNLPQWPATEFNWELNGNPNHTQLVYVDHRNEVVVDGLIAGNYTLTVKYKNTLYESCEGMAKFSFTVVDNVEVVTSGPLTLCTGTSKSFTSSNGQPVTWQVHLGEALIHTANGVGFSYTFNTGGTYVITANQNGCVSNPVVVDVIAKPTVPGGISGPNKVCLNVPYTYSVNEDDPEAVYVWSVVPAANGSVVGSNAGTQADIIITAPTATVRVVKQYTKNGVTCYSDPIDYGVSQVVLTPTIVNDTGTTLFCPSSAYTFSANLNGVVADHIEWQVLGNANQTNYGSVISGINSPTVTVNFNEVSATGVLGKIRLKVVKCGNEVVTDYPVQLMAPPTLTIGTVNDICPNDQNVKIPITSSATTGTLVFTYSSDYNIHTVPFTGSGNYFIPQHFTSSATTSVGAVLTVKLKTVVNGCTQEVTVNKSVLLLPRTKVTAVSSKKCLAPGGSATITVSVSTGITPSMVFDLFDTNDTHLQQSYTPSFVVTQPGSYYVMVRDRYNCDVYTKIITIGNNCGGLGSGCTGVTPTLTYTWVNCTEVKVTATYVSSTFGSVTNVASNASYGGVVVSETPYNPNTYQYEFVYDFQEVGVHDITVWTYYSDCVNQGHTTIEFPKFYEPILKYAVICNGNNNYNVTLYNNSNLFKINQSDVTFTYSGPGVPLPPLGGHGQNITIPNLAPGTYTYYLTLTTTKKPGDYGYINQTPNVAMPACTIPVTFTLEPTPDLNFDLLPSYCAEEPINLVVTNYNYPTYKYSWWYNGTHIKDDGDNATQINVPNAGDVYITLKAEMPNGCIYESAAKLTNIKKAEFFGSISPNPIDACEGNIPALNFNPDPFTATPASVLWMKDDQQVATTTTYVPTESGSYWPVLVNGNGCKFYEMAKDPAIVKVRKPPFVSINGSTSVCFGENTVLTGIITDPTVEHRWAGPGLPFGYTNWVTGINTNLSLPLNGLATGTYTYTLHARPVSDPSCVSQFTVTVTVHPQVTPPTIQFKQSNCQPYTLHLIASGPNNGTYNWSNGMVGKDIYVPHGGAYSVTYTAPTGCSATGYNNNIPHNPERALWIVPSGCYSLCGYKGYLIGPWGQYQGYQWLVNGNPVQTGTGTILNQTIGQPGYYQLAVTQNGCTYYSNTPFIDPHACNRSRATSSSNTLSTIVFALSPNPAVDVTTAVYDTGSNLKASHVTVHDVTGVQRVRQTVNNAKGEIMLNVSHLAAGTYMVNLHAGGNVIAQQKLIKK